jgi:hypothetical protein
MAKRLTINGFWHRSKPSAPRDGVPEDAWVSARMYGPQAPEAAPVVVL